MYYLLARVVRISAYVGRLVLLPNISILDIMAERGPFEDAPVNLESGSSHNIPLDRTAPVIDQLIKFYQQHR